MDKAAHQTSKLSFKPLSPLGQTSVDQEMTPTLSLSSVDISTPARVPLGPFLCGFSVGSFWILPSCSVFLSRTPCVSRLSVVSLRRLCP